MNTGIRFSDGAYILNGNYHGEWVCLGWGQVVIRLSASGQVTPVQRKL